MLQKLGKETGKNVSDRLTILLTDADKASSNYPAQYQPAVWKGYVEAGLKRFVEELETGSFLIHKK